MSSYILISLLLMLYTVSINTKISYYFLTERPAITHINHKYLSYANLTSKRKDRRSPVYYVDLHFNQLVFTDDTFKESNKINLKLLDILVPRMPATFPSCIKSRVDFYFYQYLSNEYRRSFVEMHFSWCSLIHKDPFFGAAMKQGKLAEPCPYPPGDYHLFNMSIPPAVIPPGFPFEKGRIYANITHRGEDVVGGHIDMELKEKRNRDKTEPRNSRSK